MGTREDHPDQGVEVLKVADSLVSLFAPRGEVWIKVARSSTSTNSRRSNLTSKAHSASCGAQALGRRKRGPRQPLRGKSRVVRDVRKGRVACAALRARPSVHPLRKTRVCGRKPMCARVPPLAIGLVVKSARSRWDLSRPHRSPCQRQVLFCRRPRRVFFIASLSARATADVAETGAFKKTRFGLTKQTAARRASRRPLTELPPTEWAAPTERAAAPRAIRHPQSELPPPERVGARRASCHPRSEPAPTEQAAALRASR